MSLVCPIDFEGKLLAFFECAQSSSRTSATSVPTSSAIRGRSRHFYRLQAGQVNSCGESVRWCYDRLPGALDRMVDRDDAGRFTPTY